MKRVEKILAIRDAKTSARLTRELRVQILWGDYIVYAYNTMAKHSCDSWSNR